MGVGGKPKTPQPLGFYGSAFDQDVLSSIEAGFLVIFGPSVWPVPDDGADHRSDRAEYAEGPGRKLDVDSNVQTAAVPDRGNSHSLVCKGSVVDAKGGAVGKADVQECSTLTSEQSEHDRAMLLPRA